MHRIGMCERRETAYLVAAAMLPGVAGVLTPIVPGVAEIVTAIVPGVAEIVTAIVPGVAEIVTAIVPGVAEVTVEPEMQSDTVPRIVVVSERIIAIAIPIGGRRPIISGRSVP